MVGGVNGRFSHLLAFDTLLSRLGYKDGLNPALKAAIEADQCWPSKSAGPTVVPPELPGSVVVFPSAQKIERGHHE